MRHIFSVDFVGYMTDNISNAGFRRGAVRKAAVGKALRGLFHFRQGNQTLPYPSTRPSA